MAGRAGRRDWGSVRPAGKGFQASYVHDGKRWFGPHMFVKKGDATDWLILQKAAISNGTWVRPDLVVAAPDSLKVYATNWLARKVKIEVRTREHYQYLLDAHILPTLGDISIREVQIEDVDTWYAREAPPTAKAHAYVLLAQIMKDAMRRRVIDHSPCLIQGGSTAPTAKDIEPATRDEVAALAEKICERYRMLVLLGAYCSLRFGELAGLRLEDVDLESRVLYIRRGVVRTKDGLMAKAPKTRAGARKVHIPRKLIDDLRLHMKLHSTEWVFPARYGGPLPWSSAQKVFNRAAEAIGRPDMTMHVLRHSGQTWAAESGATLPVLMDRAGQVSATAALRYIHAVDETQRRIADDL